MIVHVELGASSYPIYIGKGFLNDFAAILQKHRRFEDLFIITDSNVEKLYAAAFAANLGSLDPRLLTVPAGETSKSLACADALYTQLIRHQASRRSMIIAFGGGVVGDLAGFVAATFMRGIGFAQVPTTILSQVDSSVGGKVGINHPLGKNLVGAFYQPSFVLIDPALLDTLNLRERCAGLAEVIKYGLIRDRELFDVLAGNIEKVVHLTDSGLVEHVLSVCCRIKAGIVAEDEKETGVRAVLNFGHTLGHALEAATRYEVFLHGEAVLHGMRAALYLSHRAGGLDRAGFESGLALLKRMNAPAIPGYVTADALLEAMQHDKKRSREGQQWVLLQDIGRSFLTRQVAREQVMEAVEFALA